MKYKPRKRKVWITRCDHNDFSDYGLNKEELNDYEMFLVKPKCRINPKGDTCYHQDEKNNPVYTWCTEYGEKATGLKLDYGEMISCNIVFENIEVHDNK